MNGETPPTDNCPNKLGCSVQNTWKLVTRTRIQCSLWHSSPFREYRYQEIQPLFLAKETNFVDQGFLTNCCHSVDREKFTSFYKSRRFIIMWTHTHTHTTGYTKFWYNSIKIHVFAREQFILHRRRCQTWILCKTSPKASLDSTAKSNVLKRAVFSVEEPKQKNLMQNKPSSVCTVSIHTATLYCNSLFQQKGDMPLWDAKKSECHCRQHRPRIRKNVEEINVTPVACLVKLVISTREV